MVEWLMLLSTAATGSLSTNFPLAASRHRRCGGKDYIIKIKMGDEIKEKKAIVDELPLML